MQRLTQSAPGKRPARQIERPNLCSNEMDVSRRFRSGLTPGAEYTIQTRMLHKMPAFQFENWAVQQLNGRGNKVKVGDKGIDGRIYPVSAIPDKAGKAKGEFEFTDVWYPIQVK